MKLIAADNQAIFSPCRKERKEFQDLSQLPGFVKIAAGIAGLGDHVSGLRTRRTNREPFGATGPNFYFNFKKG
jgi:hypothetical protein